MENIKINLLKPVKQMYALTILDMVERNGELNIKVTPKDYAKINIGKNISFVRRIYDGENFKILEHSVKVLSKGENNVIHTNIIPSKELFLSKNSNDIRKVNGCVPNKNGENEKYTYYCIKCIGEHNLFPQDLSLGLQEITFKSINNETLGTYNGRNINIPYNNSFLPTTSANCITISNVDNTCGKKYKKATTYDYVFLPKNISRNSIIINGLSSNVVDEMHYITLKHNSFYYYYVNNTNDPNELDDYGNPIKHCVFYNDPWWITYNNKNKNNNGDLYVNKGDASTEVMFYDAFWDIDIGCGGFYDESSMSEFENFTSNLKEEIEDSLIPDVIDMERVKYTPSTYNPINGQDMFYKWVSADDKLYTEVYTKGWISDDKDTIDVYTYKNKEFIKLDEPFLIDSYNNGEYILVRESTDENIGLYGTLKTKSINYVFTSTNEIKSNSLEIATGVTFNLHFRKRDTLPIKNNSSYKNPNSPLTSGNVYTDGWFINPDNAETTWWNNMDYDGEKFDKEAFTDFINKNGCNSDLIGCLNFTDNDIFYRKSKVSKSFIRLSFYTSTDAITQKLLFYSTVFLDSTNLYGKFLKQKSYMEESGYFKRKNNLNLNAAVVFCDDNTISARLDTKLTITNEFDKTKSSEGFNIYLFAEDRNFRRENGEKTIYMKVEFNHAGNGKTIPMILWPKDENGEYTGLTIENFLTNLYIPVKIAYFEDRYIYYIPDAFKNENGNIELVLFEPKLDVSEDNI